MMADSAAVRILLELSTEHHGQVLKCTVPESCLKYFTVEFDLHWNAASF